jgi:hypothetical protein
VQTRKTGLAQLFGSVVDTFWVYSGIPFLRGKRKGRKDFQSGKLALQTFGRPAAWRDTYAALLERNGILLEAVSEDFVNGRQREEIRGYNSVMKKQIVRKHGKDFIQMIVEQAREQAEKQQNNR